MEYKFIPPERYDDVIKHLRDFFLSDEPLNKAVGLAPVKGVGNRELENLSCETLQDNLSIMAVTKDEQQEIAGVILNGVLHPGDIESSQKKLELSDDEKFKKIFRLLYAHNCRANVFEKFDVDKVFDVRIVSVDSGFRGHRIGQNLLQRSEDLAKEMGFKLMRSDATGYFSQKIFKNLGWEVLSEVFYDKYVDGEEKTFANIESPHTKCQLVYKCLD